MKDGANTASVGDLSAVRSGADWLTAFEESARIWLGDRPVVVADFHRIAATCLRIGIALDPPGPANCIAAAQAVAALHETRSRDWNVAMNNAWSCATGKSPADWLAKAAAKSAHGADEGWHRDLATTAGWIAFRCSKSPRETWRTFINALS
jgi:hypothetical protein